jgi:hypothetical protein
MPDPSRPSTPPALRAAVDASVGWYEDICALHDTATVLRDGLWSAVGPPPPLHSGAVVVEPGVRAEQVLERMGTTGGGVKDSFAEVDLGAHGWSLLFAASWLFRPPAPAPEPAPAGWSVVRTAEQLAAWTAGHDTAEVLLPGLLRSGHLVVLERQVGGTPVAGAVARLGSGTVDVSNVHAAPGHQVDWSELAAVVGQLFPGRPLVGYERGDDLTAALAGGFQVTGELRVWVP